MRTITGAETTVLNSAHLATFARVLVEDADGTYQDLTNQDSLDWIHSGSVAQSIDQIVATGNFTFWRKQEGGNSLAPLDEDSTLNRDAMAAYAPLIDVGRGIRCELATVAIGSSPSGSDWQRVLDGVIDDWRVEDDFVNVTARGAIGAEIADRWIEQEMAYGTEAGRAIEDVMQDILAEFSSLTLYTPSSPGFLVTTYRQQRSSVMDALQQLAALIGWVVQPRWDDGTSAFRLTFYEPDRAASVAEWTWASDRYEKVLNFKKSRLHIRNALSLFYTDTSNIRAQVTAEDATSISDYDRQWMEIEEAEDSAIDTEAEAQAMIDAALLDLKDPVADQEIKTFSFWPIQLGDYYQFNGNAVHYSESQLFGVTGFRHEFSRGHVDTFIRTRGKPAGFIKPWIVRAGRDRTDLEKKFALTLYDIHLLHDLPSEGNITVRWTRGSKVFAVWAYSKALTQPIDDTDSPWPDDATLPTKVMARGTDEIVIAAPDSNSVAFLQLEPRAEDGEPGNPVRVQVDPGAIADGTVTTFFQDSAPTAESVGDLWFDTDDGKAYRWSGTVWEDTDTTADITGIEITFAADGDIIVSAQGDGDTANIYVTVSDGGTPSDPTIATNDGSISGRSGSVDTTVAATVGNIITAKAVGANSETDLGPVVSAQALRGLGNIAGKKMRIAAADFIVQRPSTTWFFNSSGYLHPGAPAYRTTFYAAIVLPKGVTIEEFHVRVNRGGAADVIVCKLISVTDAASASTQSTLTAAGTGWETLSATGLGLSVSDTNEMWIIEAALTANTGPTAVAAKLLWAELIYNSPELDKTL